MKAAALLASTRDSKLEEGWLLPCCYGTTARSTGTRYSDLPMQHPHSLAGPPPAPKAVCPLVSLPGEPLFLPLVSAAAP